MKRIFAVLTFFVLDILAGRRAATAGGRQAGELQSHLHSRSGQGERLKGDETITIRVLKPTSEITLNAVDIDFHDVTITSGGATQKAKVTAEKEKEMVVLGVEKPLAAGPAKIHITYTGILNSEMRGLYLGKDDHGRKYAATAV